MENKSRSIRLIGLDNMCKKNATPMFSISFEPIAIDDFVMKILMECVTAQRAAAPLNKNDSRIDRHDFVTFRDAAFKLQKF